MRPVRERAIAGEILLTIYCCLRSSPVGLSNGEGGMGRISAFVLAYNEAEKIKAAIETVLWADEIVVVDFALSGVRELARCRARQTTFQADQRQESVFSATRLIPFSAFRHQPRVGRACDVSPTCWHLGGRRPWFICSVRANGRYCGRRVAVLYLAGELFACRKCYGLAYASQRGVTVSQPAQGAEH